MLKQWHQVCGLSIAGASCSSSLVLRIATLRSGTCVSSVPMPPKKNSVPAVPLPAGLVTVKVNEQKKMSKAKAPRPKKSKANKRNKKAAIKLVCPSRAAVMAVDYPVHFRTVEFALQSTHTSIFVFAPYNDVLGARYDQAASPPDGVTVPVVTLITDTYLTSLFSPPIVGAETNCCAARWTDFCVECICTTALQSVEGTASVMRWQQTGVPLVAGGTAAALLSTFNTAGEDELAEEVSSARLASGLCVHAAMNKRGSLDFMNVSTGSSAWANVYSNTAPADNSGESFNAPFTPIVFAITVPTSSFTQYFKFVVKGNLQVAPPRSWFLSRLAREIPIGTTDAENAWMRMQHKILKSPLFVAPNMISRDPRAYVGL